MSYLEPRDTDSQNTRELKGLVADVAIMYAEALRKDYDEACASESQSESRWGGKKRTKHCEQAKQILIEHLDRFDLAGSVFDPR